MSPSHRGNAAVCKPRSIIGAGALPRPAWEKPKNARKRPSEPLATGPTILGRAASDLRPTVAVDVCAREAAGRAIRTAS